MTATRHTPATPAESAEFGSGAAPPRDNLRWLPRNEAAAWRRGHVPASEEYQAEHGPGRQPR
jgi:hypothetical protein